MNDKQLVADYAAQQIKSGMVVGLGTGSTANYFIEALAQRVQSEAFTVSVVASSTVSMIKAQQLGLPLVSVTHLKKLDVYVDGADEVTADLTLLKGRGFDLVNEKLLASAADEFMVLIDASKQVNRIGENFPIPAEVMPFSWQLVKHQLEQSGAKSTLRKTVDQAGLVVSSYGSLVLDITFDDTLDSQSINTLLNNTAGIVEHGIFQNIATSVFIAQDGVVNTL